MLAVAVLDFNIANQDVLVKVILKKHSQYISIENTLTLRKTAWCVMNFYSEILKLRVVCSSCECWRVENVTKNT